MNNFFKRLFGRSETPSPRGNEDMPAELRALFEKISGDGSSLGDIPGLGCSEPIVLDRRDPGSIAAALKTFLGTMCDQSRRYTRTDDVLFSILAGTRAETFLVGAIKRADAENLETETFFQRSRNELTETRNRTLESQSQANAEDKPQFDSSLTELADEIASLERNHGVRIDLAVAERNHLANQLFEVRAKLTADFEKLKDLSLQLNTTAFSKTTELATKVSETLAAEKRRFEEAQALRTQSEQTPQPPPSRFAAHANEQPFTGA